VQLWNNWLVMLKILFLAANPNVTERAQLDAEASAASTILTNAGYRNRFELDSYWTDHVGDLHDLLLRYRPDIVHFSGTGANDSAIALRDSSGKSAPVPPLALSLLFRAFKEDIRCVVLDCCGLADQEAAIAEHVDCVVGIPAATGELAAHHFAATFYQGLADGRTAGESYDLATLQWEQHGLVDEKRPLLLGAADPVSLYLVTADDAVKRMLPDPAAVTGLHAATGAPVHTHDSLPAVTRTGGLPDPLTEHELREFLAKYPQWALVDTRDENASEGVRRELYRVYEFPSYQLAFRFMNEVSERAIVRQSHHPRWQNTWNRVEIWLTTFNLGYRPSIKDLRLAEACEQAWRELRRSFVW
jgi:pterin-4a-carbinolamine dehydratase